MISEACEVLKGLCITPPRRVRYQTALRPDTWENAFLL
jgi:hypothetical protein